MLTLKLSKPVSFYLFTRLTSWESLGLHWIINWILKTYLQWIGVSSRSIFNWYKLQTCHSLWVYFGKINWLLRKHSTQCPAAQKNCHKYFKRLCPEHTHYCISLQYRAWEERTEIIFMKKKKRLRVQFMVGSQSHFACSLGHDDIYPQRAFSRIKTRVENFSNF